MNKAEFQAKITKKVHLLDGAMGSCLQSMGMPVGGSTELWAERHPDVVQALQERYVAAGSDILYTPTFLAQPLALEKYGRAQDAEHLNESLARLTRRATGKDTLVGGDLATMAGSLDAWDEENFDLMVAGYRRQIQGLLAGGVDFLAAETLLYPLEAEAILAAAELEGSPAVLYSFTMQPDGSLFSGRDLLPVLQHLEELGAAAVGFNCVPASDLLSGTVSRFRRGLRVPLSVKPNAGTPIIGPDNVPKYSMAPQEFARIAGDMVSLGADLIGGCCGTTPDFIRAVSQTLSLL